jgi:uncharacterized DUF497 family protein
MEIEYHKEKAEANSRKHGVSFEEAATVLLDERALVMEDSYTVGEPRWILMGMSDKARLLTVIYTLRTPETIRLISARKSTRKESQYYAR